MSIDEKPLDNYFAHTRVEDLPKEGKYLEDIPKKDRYKNGDTRRVIELQSDLFQKGNLEKTKGDWIDGGDNNGPPKAIRDHAQELYHKHPDTAQPRVDYLNAEADKHFAQLEPYRNTWHERVIREEVKQAAKDGKTKLQFPTGETAMKIEGLGQAENDWRLFDYNRQSHDTKLTAENLKVGAQVQDMRNQGDWIITDVLGDGKFRAVQRDSLDSLSENLTDLGHAGPDDTIDAIRNGDKKVLDLLDTETFDISGKVDKENPIYKFYEKEVGRYLAKKYDAKRITDPQGVTWNQIDVPKDAAKQPVTAYAAIGSAALAKKEEQN